MKAFKIWGNNPLFFYMVFSFSTQLMVLGTVPRCLKQSTLESTATTRTADVLASFTVVLYKNPNICVTDKVQRIHGNYCQHLILKYFW